MDSKYELTISIFQDRLEILHFQLEVLGSCSLEELYNDILQKYPEQIINKVYTKWISKINGLGKFGYTDRQTIQNMFGNMLKGQFSIYTQPDQAPKDSDLDIFCIIASQLLETDKLFCVGFIFMDGQSGVQNYFGYQCRPSTLFFDAIQACYRYQSINPEAASFQFEKDGKFLPFGEKSTFRSLNIVSDTTIHAKTRWCGGYYCGDRLLYLQFYQRLH